MNDQDKIIIDENIDDTYITLVEQPERFRIKDFVQHLPNDYGNDFIFAMLEASISYDAKMVLPFALNECANNKEAGSEITNEEFNKLYGEAKALNPECKNEYIPLFFAYTQLIGSEKGLTKEENKLLLSQILNKIEDDKDSFPNKLYKANEEKDCIFANPPKPSKSFLKELSSFYNNLFKNEETSFDKRIIDRILNQYIDDIYTLSPTDDEVNEMVWYQRTNDVLTIKRIDEVNLSEKLLGKAEQDANAIDISKAVIEAIVNQPLYKNGKYNFSYVSTALHILNTKCDQLIEECNAQYMGNLAIPDNVDLLKKDKETYMSACKFFIASNVIANFIRKQNNYEEKDPYNLLAPNLKLNIIKANDVIFNLSTENEDQTIKNVRTLIGIAESLASFLEKVQTKKITKPAVIKLPNVSNIEVIRNMVRYLQNHNFVFNDDLNEIQKIKDHQENGRNYQIDNLKLAQYREKYAVANENISAKELFEIVDRKADKFNIALNILDKNQTISKLSSYIEAYNNPKTPDVVKTQQLKQMNNFINKTLDEHRIKDSDTKEIFTNIFNEALTFVPEIKYGMIEDLIARKYTSVKSNQAFKKVTSFRNVVASTLHLNKDKCSTTYRYMEDILGKVKVSEEQKSSIKDYVVDGLTDVIKELEQNDNFVYIDILEELKDRFIEKYDKQYSLMNNGIISTENQKYVLNKLKEVYEGLLSTNKKELSPILNKLNSTLPNLVKKLPSEENISRKLFIDLICKYNEKSEEQLKDQISFEAKYFVNDDNQDPYKFKDKYKKLVPENEYDNFDKLWKTLSKKSVRSRDILIFKENLNFLIKNLDKDEKLAYNNYLKALFPTRSEKLLGSSKEEQKAINEYKAMAREKLVELIDHCKDIEAYQGALKSMQEILDRHSKEDENELN